MKMNELAIAWAEWRAFHGASAESINQFCNYYAKTEKEYESLRELLKEEEDQQKGQKPLLLWRNKYAFD